MGLQRGVPKVDLEEIILALASVIEDLRNAKIFLTGGTGFFGIWLIESFLAINKHYHLNAELFVLSRNPSAFLAKYPCLQEEVSLHFIEGGVQNFVYPDIKVTHVIHAATSANTDLIEKAPLEMLDTIINGTRHLLDFCVQLKTQPKILLTSSGAVYGEQPSEMTHLSESMPTAPDLYGVPGAYSVGKCMSEHLCYQYHRLYDLPIKIARCFAFVGPHLPLNGNYAIGNFIADRLASRPINVKATKKVFRSYQYPSDLVIWLWTILLSGQSVHPYNVGSDEDYPLQEVAKLIAELEDPHLPLRLAPLAEPIEVSRYAPSIELAKKSLGLCNRIQLSEAIIKTHYWHRASYAP